MKWGGFCGVLLALSVAGCTENRGDDQALPGVTTAPAGTGANGTDTGAEDEAPKLDVGGGDSDGSGESAGGECSSLGGDATLRGTVNAPNQEIPVSGALVYVTDERPDGVPQTVYCAACVELACRTPHALTEPDGSFAFSAPSGSGKFLVVQKGQFMRVTALDLEAGDNDFGADLTSLPDHNDPGAGLYIPRIALAWGQYDRLEDALGKLGLADTIIDRAEFREDFVPGTEQFEVWDNAGSFLGSGPETTSRGGFAQLLGSYALMEQYHIIFVPCSNDTALSALNDPQVVQNIQDWVAAGGKFYASDWSNEFIERVFPQYQDFYTEDGTPDLLSNYDSQGTVLDNDMNDWLAALPDGIKNINPTNAPGASFPTVNNPPSIETVENWSGISSAPPVMVDDGMGGMVDVGHKVWIEGPGDGFVIGGGNHPLTVTGEYGCGKLLFTTYHMAELDDSYVGLTPQELVLLYLILEIGVCQTPYTPPPPVG